MDYLKNAQRIIKNAEITLKNRKGECGSCKWSAPGLIGYTCDNPVVILASEEAEQGYDRDRVRECNTQRSRRSPFGAVVCGPDGALYEPGFFARMFGS